MNNDTANEQTSSHIIQGQIEVASHSDLTYSHHYRVCGTPSNIKDQIYALNENNLHYIHTIELRLIRPN